MTLLQLEYFLSVCRHKNISQAAAEMSISQPAMSFQIKSLEEELGIKLFIRSNAGIILTEAAAVLQSKAHLIMEQIDEIYADLQEFKKEPVQCRIGMSVNASLLLKNSILPFLVNKEGYVTSVFGASHLMRVKVLNEELDGAFICWNEEANFDEKSNSLGTIYLSKKKLVFATAVNGDFKDKEFLTPEDIKRKKIIVFSESEIETADNPYLPIISAKTNANVLFSTDQLPILKNHILQRHGSAVTLADHVLDEPDIRTIPILGIPPLDLLFIYRKSNKNPALLALKRYIKKSSFQ